MRKTCRDLGGHRFALIRHQMSFCNEIAATQTHLGTALALASYFNSTYKT